MREEGKIHSDGRLKNHKDSSLKEKACKGSFPDFCTGVEWVLAKAYLKRSFQEQR